jgi:hypothetical protein
MVFIESGIFTARLDALAGRSAADVLSQIQRDLMLNPGKGSLLRGLGGMRKARTSNPARSKGKRGGFRYFYLYLKNRQHVHLLLLLDKNEQADITNAEKKALKRLVDAVKQ